MKVTYSPLLNVLLVLVSLPSFAETLIELDSGSRFESERLLEQGDILIYVERDCGICHRYVQTLSSCSEKLKKKIKLVSVSTPAQTKEMARKLSTELALYLVRDGKGSENIAATPTTRTARRSKIGKMSCADLESL